MMLLQQVMEVIDKLILEQIVVVLCMVWAIAFAFKMFTLYWEDVGQSEVSKTVPLQAQEEYEEKEKEEDDLQFLRRRVIFLTEKELDAIELGRYLGRGGYGSVMQAVCQGNDAVIKVFLEQNHIHIMLKEARTAVKVDGAGGVPRVLALCEDPLAIKDRSQTIIPESDFLVPCLLLSCCCCCCPNSYIFTR